MKSYNVKITPKALADIQEIIDWYDDKLPGLGKRFLRTVTKQINSLHKNPLVFSIRYKEVRCMLMKKFPYMVHFQISSENQIIEVLAVISTSRNPKIWKEKVNN